MWFLIALVTSMLASPPVEHAQVPVAPGQPVAEVAALRFHSDVLMNLHHTLYAAAWARRPEAGTFRALAGALPAPLDAAMTEEDRRIWSSAIDFYDKQLADRDLLFGRGMMALKGALVDGDLASDAVGPELRDVLTRALPVYTRSFWPGHDRANRAWISSTADRMREVAPDVIVRLEKLYAEKWPTVPVRVDIVWVGNRQGAYTTVDPPHVTISSGDPENGGWTGIETAFHEVSHVLVLPLQSRLTRALGDRAGDHRVLWHVIQFYVTGAAVRQVLKARGIDYVPYMYSTGLFDRAWGRYRALVERNWQPYVDGKVSLDVAIAETVKMLDAPPVQ
jgi:hypothetical protein